MADISFQNDPSMVQFAPQRVTNDPLFIRLILKTGVVSDATQAKNILFIIAAIAIILAGFSLWHAFGTSGPSSAQMDQIKELQKEGKLPFVPS